MSKIIDLLDKMLSAPVSTRCRAYTTEMMEAKQEAKWYRWHDLRVDPDDLPEEFITALVAHEYFHWKKEKRETEYDTGFYSAGLWIGDAGNGHDNRVLAWRYIEPFEEVER